MSAPRFALIGNPNTGKTSVFNRLTGTHQRVGNWAGVTVEKKSGTFFCHSGEAEIIDLPGVYSIDESESGVDEAIARQYLVESPPDLVLNIVDASNLERHLLLTKALIDLNLPVILVLNMSDVAARQNIKIDADGLGKNLGVPVVAISAADPSSLSPLRELLNQRIAEPRLNTQETATALCEEESLAQRFHWVQQKVGGVVIAEPSNATLTQKIDRVVLHRFLGIPIFFAMMYLMFTLAINFGAVFIDFFDILLGTLLVDGTASLLSAVHTPDWLITLIAHGVGGGIQLVGTFIPVIGFLYLFLSLLEDSGYMARAAFVVDRLMARIGLPGNAFVPLIVGFGCNVPAVMASRTLTREQDRLLIIAMSPFMSCGARLTVYALFAAAFFGSLSTVVVFILYMFGIVMAVFTGWLFRKTLFTGVLSPSFQEMPVYHLPIVKNVLLTTWHRLNGFIRRAGATIVKVVVFLTLINSVSMDGSFGNENTQESLLSHVSKAITPAFAPIGIQEENWPATVGVFTGVFAKEAVVGTLDALYQDVANAGMSDVAPPSIREGVENAFISIYDNFIGLTHALTDPLGFSAVNDSAEDQGVSATGLKAMQGLFGSNYAAFCYLVFILLYTPCVAVMGAMNRESGPMWASLVIGWSSFLAYWAASILYQISQVSLTPLFSLCWISGAIVAMMLAVKLLSRLGKSSYMPSKNLIATDKTESV